MVDGAARELRTVLQASDSESVARQADIVQNQPELHPARGHDLVLGVSSLQWAVGAFCVVVGALMLVAPHRVVLAWVGPRLKRLDPGSLHTRLALVLAAAAVVLGLLAEPTSRWS
jgi:hypothetical protein